MTGADAKKTQTEIQGLTQRLDELQNTTYTKTELDESLRGENGELAGLRKAHDEKIDATNKRLDELQNAGALQKDLDERTAEFPGLFIRPQRGEARQTKLWRARSRLIDADLCM